MERTIKRNYKQPKVLRLLFMLLFVVFALAGCQTNTPSSSSKEEYISVILVQGEHFAVLENDAQSNANSEANVAHIKKNSDLTFWLIAENDYQPENCSYEEHVFAQLDKNTYSLKLQNVKYSLRLNVSFKYVQPVDPPDIDDKNVITYDTNGGTMLEGKENKQYYTTEHHPRPNTSLGTDIMYREGYNLIGWNTEEDGSGEHIGLGSRYLDIENCAFTLYAEWAQYSNINTFEYTVDSEDQVTITNYLGSDQKISIPEYIQGKPVSFIEENAIVDSTAKVIILPKSIQTVAKGAFKNCAFEDIYLFDNIVGIYDGCFVNCSNLKTVHINAIEAPKYVTADRNVTYADKVDRLILNKDKKKIIILGGSGAYYNVDACLLKKHHPDYEVFNLAVNGYFNGPVQMETIIKFMGERDYLLHVVEMCGKFQFMTDISMCNFTEDGGYDYRFYCSLEQNFDIISYVDIRHVGSFFDMFTVFNNAREKKPPLSYTDYTDFADERGDYTSENRKKIIPVDGGKIITHEGAIDYNCISEEGAGRLANYYQELAQKVVNVVFMYCPVNKDSLSLDDLDEANIMEFGARVLNWISPYCRVVNSIETVLFDFEWFADSDWHLDYEHALIFTEQVNSYLGKI